MVSQINARLREAANLGFKSAVVPRRLHRKESWPGGIEVTEARSLREALKLALIE
jgi:DNA repair protein RadA/Sms